MNETKTGALVCKKNARNNQFAYKPLAFITGIPASFTDEDLKRNFDLSMLINVLEECVEILFRADLHATSNEVQEEYELLHEDSPAVPTFEFRQKPSIV